MKSFTQRQSAFVLLLIFAAFCWMSNDDLAQQEMAYHVQGNAK